MKLHSLLAATAVVFALALPNLANATIAYAAAGVTNLRAGPGTNHPVVAQVRGGSRVDVHNCLQDRPWCEATAGGVRGWMAASRLNFAAVEQREIVIEEAPGSWGWAPGATGSGNGGGEVRCLAPHPIC